MQQSLFRDISTCSLTSYIIASSSFFLLVCNFCLSVASAVNNTQTIFFSLYNLTHQLFESMMHEHKKYKLKNCTCRHIMCANINFSIRCFLLKTTCFLLFLEPFFFYMKLYQKMFSAFFSSNSLSLSLSLSLITLPTTTTYSRATFCLVEECICYLHLTIYLFDDDCCNCNCDSCCGLLLVKPVKLYGNISPTGVA